MTTPRTRRNKPAQARDILLALLKEQEATVDDLTRKVNTAVEVRDRTKRLIELLDQAVLPGMETVECVCGYNPENGYRLDVVCVAHPRQLFPVPVGRQPEGPPMGVVPLDVTTPLGNIHTIGIGPSLPRQRIGEKADVNDVWPAPELGPTNHSKLMYSRAKDCTMCMDGVPFATEKRTEHYIVTKDAKGVERGFEYRPCTGIKEWDVATKDFGKGDA